MNAIMRAAGATTGLALLLLASGCTIMQADKIDYKSAGRGVSLEVPPDLSQLPNESRYAVADGSVSASDYARQKSVTDQTTSNTAPSSIADVQYVRDGNQRWLHVNRAPDRIWNEVHDFWIDSGFLLAVDQPNIGLMETDWAENRAKIPQDIIRRTIGKVFDSLYSTGERDRFRTRVERTKDGGSDIFITHQGMEEVYSSQEKDSTVWQPRPRDPGLEAEFLRRLMVKLGVSEERAKTLTAEKTAAAKTVASAEIITLGSGTPAVRVNDGFDRAWRRVGLALDRTGFTVEDRDRSKGLYFVRYVDPKTQKKEPGFLSKLFGGTSAPLPTREYQILVQAQGDQASTVEVQNRSGAPVAADDAQHITKVLADELK